MSGSRITLSIIYMLAASSGLYIIARNVMAGSAPAAWGLFCLLVCSALVMHRIIDRLPMSHEAIFRLANAKHWPELSPVQRRCLMLFDWPLFWEIRNREAQRLGSETLFRFNCEGNGIALEPVEGQRIERYFLKGIASAIERYGLRVHTADKGLDLFNRKGAAELRFAGDDGRIIQYVRNKFDDGDLVSLQSFSGAVEAGYISTLPEEERYAYVMAMR